MTTGQVGPAQDLERIRAASKANRATRQVVGALWIALDQLARAQGRRLGVERIAEQQRIESPLGLGFVTRGDKQLDRLPGVFRCIGTGLDRAIVERDRRLSIAALRDERGEFCER